MDTLSDREVLKANVQEKYGAAASRVATIVATGETPASCCGSSACCGATTEAWDPITSDLYDEGQTAGIPAEALLASLGCGNPTALAQLNSGETVLDLGSGGGIDVLLSAKRVGPTGKAYGLDMTDEMLALANENRRKAGAENVEFLRGEIEQIPLPDNTVDVIISNCVINLSADKKRVIAEAYRVLKPGGRLAVSDVVVRGAVPPEVRRNMELWIGCVAGALGEQEFLTLLRDAGFENPSIEPTRFYSSEDAMAFLAGSGLDAESFAREIDGKFFSGFVRATKPLLETASTEGTSCCGPDCCGTNEEAPIAMTQKSARSIAYRSAEAGDRAAVERLLKALGLPIAGVPDDLRNFVVATHGGDVIGVTGLELADSSAVLLRSVGVDPAHRKNGVARRLVALAIEDARSMNIRSVYLLTPSAATYFARWGFVVSDRSEIPAALAATSEFQGACSESTTLMKLDLLNQPDALHRQS
jgi:arsenite methyltransferase